MKFSRQHREGRPDVERPLLKPSTSRRRQWSPRRFGAKRLISRYIIAVLLAVATLVTVTIAHAHSRQTFFLLTDFTSYDETWLSRLSNALPEEPTREIRSNGDIGDRYILKHTLASGAEGATSVFHDNVRDVDLVIKRYNSQHRAMRNTVPAHISTYFGDRVTHWPAELPASLLFGGLQNETADELSRGDQPFGFIPVYDYFLTFANGRDWHWNFAAPLLASGTLKTLARKLQQNASSTLDVVKLDEQYRPAFNGVQSMLNEVHERGFCHDDVKAGNIFIRNESDWILADLGAIREKEHPAHSTWVWRSMNQWQDCQRNDQRRLLKTYMAFLRQASSTVGTVEDFGRRFFFGDEDWAGMYWSFMAGELPTKARQYQQWRGKEPSWWAPARLFWGQDKTRRFAVDRELDGDLQDSWLLWRLRDVVFLGSWRMEDAWSAIA